MGRPTYWTEERIRSAAEPYEFASDFAKGNPKAYATFKSRHSSLKKELFPVFKKLVWTNEKLGAEAMKYETRQAFRNGSMGAYSRACHVGIMDEICGHMKNTRIKAGRIDLGQYVGLSGIYFLVCEEELVYIGKSQSCMVDRVRWHYESKSFDQVKMYPVESHADILVLEAYLIALHKPEHNVEYVTPDKLSFTLTHIDELLGEPIVVAASFGVNATNAVKGK